MKTTTTRTLQRQGVGQYAAECPTCTGTTKVQLAKAEAAGPLSSRDIEVIQKCDHLKRTWVVNDPDPKFRRVRAEFTAAEPAAAVA